MCGSNSQQKQISDAQQQMYTNLNNNYATTFGQQQDILKAINAEFLPIMQAGPVQQGMTQANQDAINHSAICADHQSAIRSRRRERPRSNSPPRGGGNALLPSSTTANALAAGNEYGSAESRSRSKQHGQPEPVLSVGRTGPQRPAHSRASPE